MELQLVMSAMELQLVIPAIELQIVIPAMTLQIDNLKPRLGLGLGLGLTSFFHNSTWFYFFRFLSTLALYFGSEFQIH